MGGEDGVRGADGGCDAAGGVTGRPDPGDALVDVVDTDDRVVGVVTRREMRAGRLRHRAVYILVVSTDGRRLLVHRRAETKDVMPGWWDLAAGGVVEAGESYEVAAQRELAEELGVDGPLEPLGGGAYDGDVAAVLGRVYLARHDGPFTFSDGEVTEVAWAPVDDLPTLVAEQRWCPDSVAIALPLLPSET